MPGHVATFGKHNAPGKFRWAAEEFSINKISESTEAQTDGNARRDQIPDLPEIPSLLSCDEKSCQNHANQSAVKRHPALPDFEDIQWSLQISAQVIEEHVTDASTHHDSNDDVEKQVIKIVRRQFQFPLFCEALQKEITDDERDHVHQPVPSQLNGTEPQEHRIDLRKLNL